jgi:hypothetical protein
MMTFFLGESQNELTNPNRQLSCNQVARPDGCSDAGFSQNQMPFSGALSTLPISLIQVDAP